MGLVPYILHAATTERKRNRQGRAGARYVEKGVRDGSSPTKRSRVRKKRGSGLGLKGEEFRGQEGMEQDLKEEKKRTISNSNTGEMECIMIAKKKEKGQLGENIKKLNQDKGIVRER